MHCSPTLWHIPAPAVCARNLDEGVHRGGSLTIRTSPTHLRSSNNAATHISPTSKGWKAESTLPTTGVCVKIISCIWESYNKKFAIKEKIIYTIVIQYTILFKNRGLLNLNFLLNLVFVYIHKFPFCLV